MKLSDLKPNVYPTDLLEDCTSGLCLFGAGFYGANDAIHMHNANISHVTVVDTDTEKLAVMSSMYGPGWILILNDVTTWVPNIANSGVLSWDIVSVDAPANMFDWCWNSIDLLCALANKYVVLTTYDSMVDRWVNTDEWRFVAIYSRSSKELISLMVLERNSCLN